MTHSRKMKLLHALLIGLVTLVACVPATSSVSPSPAVADSATPAIHIMPGMETQSTSPAGKIPSVTTTLFAEKVFTRAPGILTPTQVFTTITPIPRGQKIWTKGSPMPTQRSELASALLNGKIYVLGGTHVEGLTYARMEVYDPLTNSWATAAPIPMGRHHFGMAELNGKIYVSGGLPDWYRLTDTCYVYDPATDSWSQIASLPYRMATHSMAALDGKLYVVGGNDTNGGGPMPMFIYDPTSATWSQSNANMPTGREHLAVVAAEGKLFVIGGRYNQDHNVSTLEIYDPQTDTWTQGPDMPIPSSGLTAAYLDGRIHVTGGEDLFANTVINAQQVFDLATMTWELLPELPGARHGLTSQAVNGQWIVIGGSPIANIGMVSRVDIFTP